MNYNSIPRNGLLLEALLDNNVLDTNNGTKATLTGSNITYGLTSIGYQKYYGIFNGSSSYITLPVSTSFDLTTATYNFWIKLNSTTAAFANNIFDHWDETTGSGNYAGFGILYGTDGVNKFKVGVKVSNGTLGNNTTNYYTTSINSDLNWHLLTVTYTGTTSKIYLDGILQSTKTDHSTVNFSTNPLPYIGCEHREFGNTNVNFFSGGMQGIRFYNRVLSDSEIQNLYLEGKRKLGAGSDNVLKDCVAYYDFNGDANDVVGGYNGTVSGATLTTDRFGISNRAYSFDGSNDQIVASVYDINGTQNFTFHTKFKINSLPTYGTPGNANGFWIMGVQETGNTGTRDKAIVINSDGYIRGYVFDGGVKTTTSTQVISTGVYYDAVLTFNGSTLTMYIDGVSVGSVAASGSFNFTTPQLVFSQYDVATSSDYFDGVIDFGTVYLRSLSADEVKELYNLSKTRYLYPFNKQLPLNLRNGLQLWIPGHNSAGTYYDVSGNGNNGTASGSPTTTRLGRHKKTDLNGSSQYFDIPYSLRGVTTFTFNTWLTTDDLVNFRSIYSIYYNGNVVESFQLRQNNAGKIQFTDMVSTNTDSNKTLVAGTKYMVTLVRHSSNSFSLYINGYLDKSFTQTINLSGNITGEGTTPRIGKGGSFGQYWDGNIINPMIWNRALTQTEILQLYYSTFIS